MKLLSPVALVAMMSLYCGADASSLMLHYGFGEDGTVDENGFLISDADPSRPYAMTAIGNAGSAVSSGLAAPGSTAAMKGLIQKDADFSGLDTALNSDGGDGSFMLSFWIYNAGSASNQTVLQLNNDQFTVYIGPDRRLTVGRSGDFALPVSFTADLNTWTYLSIYYDAVSKKYSFAKNGAEFSLDNAPVKSGKPVSYDLNWGDGGRVGQYSSTTGSTSQPLNANTALDELKVYRMEPGDDFKTMAYNDFKYGLASIPEPSLAGLGLLGLAMAAMKRRKS